jgi:hypothetical protein
MVLRALLPAVHDEGPTRPWPHRWGWVHRFAMSALRETSRRLARPQRISWSATTEERRWRCRETI